MCGTSEQQVAERVTEAVCSWINAEIRIDMCANWEDGFEHVAEQAGWKVAKETRAQRGCKVRSRLVEQTSNKPWKGGVQVVADHSARPTPSRKKVQEDNRRGYRCLPPKSVVRSQRRDLSKGCRFLARGRGHRQLAGHNKLHYVRFVASDGGQRQAYRTIGDTNPTVGLVRAHIMQDWERHIQLNGVRQKRSRRSSVHRLGSDVGVRVACCRGRSKGSRSSHTAH